MKLDITLNGLDSGDILFNGVDSHRVIELVNGLLEAQFEQLVLQLKELSIQLFSGKFSYFTCFHS